MYTAECYCIFVSYGRFPVFNFGLYHAIKFRRNPWIHEFNLINACRIWVHDDGIITIKVLIWKLFAIATIHMLASLVTSTGSSEQFGSGIPYCLPLVNSSSHSTVVILLQSSREAEYEWPVLQSQRGKELQQTRKPAALWQYSDPNISKKAVYWKKLLA